MPAASTNPAEFVQRLRGYLHTNAALAFPLLGIVAATAAPVLAVLGPEWTDAADAMRVLCVAGAVGIVTVLLGTALLAAQRPGAEAVTNWVQAGVGALAIAAGAVATRDAGIRHPDPGHRPGGAGHRVLRSPSSSGTSRSGGSCVCRADGCWRSSCQPPRPALPPTPLGGRCCGSALTAFRSWLRWRPQR